jgi:hypothetical protein
LISTTLYSHAFPHGLCQLVLLKLPKKCPRCSHAMVLWLSRPEGDPRPDLCLACSGEGPNVEVRPE